MEYKPLGRVEKSQAGRYSASTCELELAYRRQRKESAELAGLELTISGVSGEI